MPTSTLKVSLAEEDRIVFAEAFESDACFVAAFKKGQEKTEVAVMCAENGALGKLDPQRLMMLYRVMLQMMSASEHENLSQMAKSLIEIFNRGLMQTFESLATAPSSEEKQ